MALTEFGKVFPSPGDAGHRPPDRQLPSVPDFAGDAGDFRGKERELINHGLIASLSWRISRARPL